MRNGNEEEEWVCLCLEAEEEKNAVLLVYVLTTIVGWNEYLEWE